VRDSAQSGALRCRLIVLGALLLAGATALLAVPDLRAAAHRAASISPGWLIGAVALELASCLSFIAIFRRFFAELPAPEARRLAWIEMGSGALLPGGGLGSLAAGGVLLRRGGMSTGRIVEKSSRLFFLTSGTSVLALESAALLLVLDVGGGPHGLALTVIRAAVGIAGAALVLAVSRSRLHGKWRSRASRSVVDGISQAEHELLRPHWRLLGALGYLAFDIAVLGLTCAAVGHPIGAPVLVLAYVIGYAANSLPVPGGIGVLEGGLVGALTVYGAPVMPATAAVLIYHAIAFWIPSLGGAMAYLVTSASRQRGSLTARARRPCEDQVHRPHSPAVAPSPSAS